MSLNIRFLMLLPKYFYMYNDEDIHLSSKKHTVLDISENIMMKVFIYRPKNTVLDISENIGDFEISEVSLFFYC